MSSPRELLARVPLFAGLDPADLERIARAARPSSFEDGQPIFEIGEPGSSLFVITRGSVQVVHPGREGTRELAVLGPGDFFGEMALLTDTPRSATARAEGAVHALVLDKASFRSLVLERPGVAIPLLEAMSVRIRHADDQIGELHDQAHRDPLTGLLNRRAFSTRLLEEIHRVRRYGTRFSVILLDADGFDAVNEEHGREAGDAVLAWIGRILSEHTRASDLPFRFARDAFTVLCPATGATVVRAAAERLASVVGEARTPVAEELRITISWSCVTCPEDGDDPNDLFRLAQEGLATAKARALGAG